MSGAARPDVPVPPGGAALPDVLALDNAARAYAWGSPTVLPALLGEEPTGDPVAEIWIGAHPGQPSHWQPAAGGVGAGGVGAGGVGADEPVRLGLDALVAADPEGLLGGPTARRFGGRLPFLLKLLAAEGVLSLQVHPDLAQARAGFARENAAGIPVGAPHRNYQDDNHKPELLCAVTPFEALCGFRDPAVTAAILAAFDVPELAPLVQRVAGATDLRAAVSWLLARPAAEATAIVAAAVAGARRHLAAAPHGPFAAVADCFLRVAAQSPDEIGPVVALLLNRLQLQPGDAVFLAAGQIHCYVRGFGVEILANSDNVLRCGLTPKHVDVAELLAVADFAPAAPDPWPSRPVGDDVVYPVPVDDFELTRLQVGASAADVTSGGPQLLLATGGHVTVRGQDAAVALTPGHAAFVPAGRPVGLEGAGTVFRATVGPRVVP